MFGQWLLRISFTLKIESFLFTFQNIRPCQLLIYHILSSQSLTILSTRIGYFKSNKCSCPRMIVSRVLSHLKIVESFQTFNPNLRVLITLQSTIPRGCTCSWMIVSYPPKIYQSSTTLWPTIWTGCCLTNDHPESQSPATLQLWMIVSRLVSYSLKNCRIFPNFFQIHHSNLRVQSFFDQ